MEDQSRVNLPAGTQSDDEGDLACGRTNRREILKVTVGVAGGIAAAAYVKPSLQALGVPVTLAMSGSGGPKTDLCSGIYSPGYWKNYQNHYTESQFFTFLTQTQNFGSWFAGLGQSTAVSTAVTILKLQGSYNVRSLLAAELNLALMPSLGAGLFTPTGAGSPSTVSSLLSKAYSDNGSGNSSPYTNGSAWTSKDSDVAAYLSGGGEGQPASSCRVKSPG